MSLLSTVIPARRDDPPVAGTLREGWPYIVGPALLGLVLWRWRPLIGLVFLLFFAVPTGFYLKELLRTLERSRAELFGVGEARAATDVARALAVHRMYAAATLSPK